MSRFVVYAAILAAAVQALPFGWCCRFDFRLSCCAAKAQGAACASRGSCCSRSDTTAVCGGALCGDECDQPPANSSEPNAPAGPCGPRQFCCCVEVPATTPKHLAPPTPHAIATPVVVEPSTPAFFCQPAPAGTKIAGRTLCQVLCRYRC